MLVQKNSHFDKDISQVLDLFEEVSSHVQTEQSTTKTGKDKSVGDFIPKVNLTLEIFSQFRIKFFKHLHLLYEDLKLNTMMNQFTEKLGFFLYCYSSFLTVANSVNYIEYYSRDYPSFPYEFAACESLQLISKIVKRKQKNVSLSNFPTTFETEEKLFDLEVLEEEPFDVTRQLSLIVGAKDVKRYPILYKRTYLVYKIFMLYYSLKEDKIFKVFKRTFHMSDSITESILTSTPVNRVYFNLEERFNMDQQMNNSIARLNIQNKSSKPLDQIYLFLILSEFKSTSVPTYTTGVRTILECIIRDLRLNLPSYIYNPCLPKGAYTLIDREDIHMNIMLYPKVKPIRSMSSQHANSYMNHASYIE